METSQLVFNNSFSCRWLMSIKSSHGTLNDSHHSFDSTQDNSGSSFIDMDPGFISRPRMSTGANNDFDFNLSSRPESSVLVYADQIFSKGLLLPLHSTTAPASSSKPLLPRSINYHCRSPYVYSSPSMPSAKDTPNSMDSSSSSTGLTAAKSRKKSKSHFVGNCMKSSKKTLRRCLCFLIPLYKKVKCLRSSASSKPVIMRGSKDSVGSAPRTGTNSFSFSNIHWCKNEADISIYDAILHCKKSIGQDCD